MTNTLEFNTPVCESTQNSSQSIVISPVISSLTTSKTCGLALLINKLLAQGKSNTATKQLINTLINRLHYTSISINASSDDNPEYFIMEMIDTAMKISQTANLNRSSINSAAKLFTFAIKEFETNEIDFSTLEHNWKEFIYHFYRSKLIVL